MGVPSVGAQGGLPLLVPLLGPTAVKRQNYKLHRIDPRGPGPAPPCGSSVEAAWLLPVRTIARGRTQWQSTQYCCLLHRRSGNELAAEGLRGAQSAAAVALREGGRVPTVPEYREDAQELPLKQGLRNGAPVESMKRRPGYLLLSICIGHLKHISI